MSDIDSPVTLEIILRSLLGQFHIADLLGAVRKAIDGEEAFGKMVIRCLPTNLEYFPRWLGASVACYSMLYGREGSGQPLSVGQFLSILNIVQKIHLHDPGAARLSDVKEEFWPQFTQMMSRIYGEQAHFRPQRFGKLARMKLLWIDAVNAALSRAEGGEIVFESEFESYFSVTVEQYISIGYCAFALSHSNSGGRFTRTRLMEMGSAAKRPFPTADRHLKHFLQFVAADLRAFRHEFWQREARELASNEHIELVRAYPFNPLLKYPLLRPWQQFGSLDPDTDRIIAPIPELVLKRLVDLPLSSIKKRQFGYVFEEYVGILLRESFPDQQVVHESELNRSRYEGPVVDWVVREGNSIILIECKARKRPRHAFLRRGSDWAHNHLNLLKKGWEQLSEFGTAIERQEVRHPALDGVKEVCSILLTYEPHWMMTGEAGVEYLQTIYDDFPAEQNRQWTLWSVETLEFLQPFLERGLSLQSAYHWSNTETRGSFRRRVRATLNDEISRGILVRVTDRIIQELRQTTS